MRPQTLTLAGHRVDRWRGGLREADESPALAQSVLSATLNGRVLGHEEFA